MEKNYTMGIDIGSTASKCVILNNGKEIVSKALVTVGTGTSGPARVIKKALEDANLKIEDMKIVVSTGYGRHSLQEANFQISELSCHALGAYFLFPQVRTVIDIGGQDAKVLSISPNGELISFVMNDKCAAGTGRFLDVMSRILELDINQLSECSKESTEKINISSTCTVFAESEVISQLSQNKKKADIVKGIHKSVAGKVASLAKRLGVKDAIVMTGGVAQNSGVVLELEIELNSKILTHELAQYIGALGASFYGYKKLN